MPQSKIFLQPKEALKKKPLPGLADFGRSGCGCVFGVGGGAGVE